MIKDELITYNTAVLAKDKGFAGIKSQCNNWYYKDGSLENNRAISGYKGLKSWNEWEHTQGIRWDAPTQSLLQRWLREKHKLPIEVKIDIATEGVVRKYAYRVVDINKKPIHQQLHWYGFDTYELALETALLEALKRIK